MRCSKCEKKLNIKLNRKIQINASNVICFSCYSAPAKKLKETKYKVGQHCYMNTKQFGIFECIVTGTNSTEYNSRELYKVRVLSGPGAGFSGSSIYDIELFETEKEAAKAYQTPITFSKVIISGNK